jgi:hypothetical protein
VHSFGTRFDVSNDNTRHLSERRVGRRAKAKGPRRIGKPLYKPVTVCPGPPASICMRPIRNWNGRGVPPAPIRSAVARWGGGVVGTD